MTDFPSLPEPLSPEEAKAYLRKGVEWVEEQAKLPRRRRTWRQESWRTPEDLRLAWGHAQGCGTAFCLAGYLGQLLEPRFADTEYVRFPDSGTYPDVHVSAFVDHVLGLPRSEGRALIDGTSRHVLWQGENTAADIRRIAEELAGGPL